MNLSLIATSTFGLEAVVARELQAWATRARRSSRAGCCSRATRRRSAGPICGCGRPTGCWCGWGRSRPPTSGNCSTARTPCPGNEWIPADGAFPVNGRSLKSQLSSVPACQRIVKKAIVEKLKAAHGVETLDETGPQLRSRGGPAQGRGHADDRHDRRRAAQAGLPPAGRPGPAEGDAGGRPGPAQLLEARPAADRSVLRHGHDPDRSGHDRPQHGPGPEPRVRRRGLAARCPADSGQAARDEARDRAQPDCPSGSSAPTSTTRRSSLARYHAEQAGVADDIHFQQRDFADLTSKRAVTAA